MSDEKIVKEIVELVSTVFVGSNENTFVDENTNLIDDLGMDSITFISLIVELESRFNIVIPDHYLIADNFNSIINIVEIITAQLSN